MLCLHNTDENSVLCMMVVTNKFETEAASSRAAALRTWLDSGSFLVEDLQTLMGHWNVAMKATNHSMPGWLSTVRRLSSWSDDDYRGKLADRLAAALSKLKWLQYSRAHEVPDVSLLLLHRVQAGYGLPPPTTPLAELQNWFRSGRAGRPLLVASEFPELGDVHQDRTDGPMQLGDSRSVDSLGVANVHSPGAVTEQMLVGFEGVKAKDDAVEVDLWDWAGPEPSSTAAEKQAEKSLPHRTMRDMTEAELLELLAARRKKDAEEKRKGQDELQELISMRAEVAALRQELDTFRHDKGEGRVHKRQKKGQQEATGVSELMQEEEEVAFEEEGREEGEEAVELEPEVGRLKDVLLNSVLAGGSLSLKTVGKLRGEMKLGREEARLRREGEAEQFPEPQGRYEHEWNSAVDDRTAIFVRLARAEAFKQMSHDLVINDFNNELEKVTMKEEVLHYDCEVLEKRMGVLSEVLKQVRRGEHGTAQRMMDIWKREERGEKQDKDVARILKKAKAEVKEESASLTNRSIESLLKGNGGAKGGGAWRSGGGDWGSEWGPSQRRGERQKGGGKGEGMSPNQRNHEIRWTDGEAAYGAALKGIQVPPPGSFSKLEKYFMDAPGTNGLVTPAHSSIPCSGCKKRGHLLSECPARQWQDQGQMRVNWRWLYEKGVVDGRGLKV